MSQPQHTELLGLSLQQLTEVAEGFGQAPYRVRQLLDGLYRQRWSGLEQFTILPLVFRKQLIEAGYEVGLPKSRRSSSPLMGPSATCWPSPMVRASRRFGCPRATAAKPATAPRSATPRCES